MLKKLSSCYKDKFESCTDGVELISEKIGKFYPGNSYTCECHEIIFRFKALKLGSQKICISGIFYKFEFLVQVRKSNKIEISIPDPVIKVQKNTYFSVHKDLKTKHLKFENNIIVIPSIVINGIEIVISDRFKDFFDDEDSVYIPGKEFEEAGLVTNLGQITDEFDKNYPAIKKAVKKACLNADKLLDDYKKRQ